MRSREEVIKEINRKVYDVLYRSYYTRQELTVLIPIKEYYKLSIDDHITYHNHVFSKDGTEVVTVVGVKAKPVEGIDEVYVCL